MLHKINLRRFSSVLKVASAKRPTQVVLERQSLGANTDSSLSMKSISATPSELIVTNDSATTSDAAVLDSKGIFRETEEADESIQNYIDHDKSMKNDMRMINYRSKLL